MRHSVLGIMFAMAIGGLPAVTVAEESFPLIVNDAVHHDAAPPRGSDILSPNSTEATMRRELPLHYPNPKKSNKTVAVGKRKGQWRPRRGVARVGAEVVRPRRWRRFAMNCGIQDERKRFFGNRQGEKAPDDHGQHESAC